MTHINALRGQNVDLPNLKADGEVIAVVNIHLRRLTLYLLGTVFSFSFFLSRIEDGSGGGCHRETLHLLPGGDIQCPNVRISRQCLFVLLVAVE